ncbi:transcriptional regulator, TetR family [Tritonibacter mobilis]|uniref:TetR/AcrR family transcriptional regulator n=1 Tax=Tritonibacter mobilis TaxID=379347 RepID=UPI000F6BBED2|nr:TetR/AcrR family transcriptional regulator [Tritonibacter mobilis]VCU61923.1 transcriptional regulator, TetR family [Tritonibacter mobilis]
MQEPPAETKREKDLKARRAHILDAALMSFLERGYHQTGVRDIAKRAGVSLGNLYNHFSGKHDILAEIAALEHVELQPFLAELGRDGSALEVLESFVRNYLAYLCAPENVILSLEIASEAVRKPDIAEMFLKNQKVLQDALADLLTRGVTEGSLRPLPDTREAGRMILDALEGKALRATLQRGATKIDHAELWDFIKNALMTPVASPG